MCRLYTRILIAVALSIIALLFWILLPPQPPGPPQHVAARFYRLQFASCVLWWALLRRVTGRHLYELASLQGSVCTRPSWMATATLRRLHAWRTWVFVAMPVAELAVALYYAAEFYGVLPGHDDVVVPVTASWLPGGALSLRLVAAAVVSAYHLLETSVTQRHGEFPLLYNAWAMCVPDSSYASALSLGIAIHFVFSSGVAKVLVGGGVEWIKPGTMRTYLSLYGASKSAKPLIPALNKWVARRDWATTSIGAATLVLECVLIPGCLLLPPEWRFVGALTMIVMHVGITVVMSTMVGLAFFTVLPSYLVGFACLADVAASPQWWCAVVVGLGPTLVRRERRERGEREERQEARDERGEKDERGNYSKRKREKERRDCTSSYRAVYMCCIRVL